MIAIGNTVIKTLPNGISFFLYSFKKQNQYTLSDYLIACLLSISSPVTFARLEKSTNQLTIR
jgi:hypothetical protein